MFSCSYFSEFLLDGMFWLSALFLFSWSALIIFLSSACLVEEVRQNFPLYCQNEGYLSCFPPGSELAQGRKLWSKVCFPCSSWCYSACWSGLFCFLWLSFWLVWPLTVLSGYWNETTSKHLTSFLKLWFLK